VHHLGKIPAQLMVQLWQTLAGARALTCCNPEIAHHHYTPVGACRPARRNSPSFCAAGLSACFRSGDVRVDAHHAPGFFHRIANHLRAAASQRTERPARPPESA